MCEYREFQKFAEVDIHKILHPSQTRWLSLASVVKRILEQWSALQLFFNQKWLDEHLLAVEQIHQALNDPFIKLYYLFLNFVLPKISSLNQYFQSEKVLIVNLDKAMKDAYTDFLLCYMERTYVMNTDLEHINPSNETYLLKPIANMYLGVDVLNEISKPEIVKNSELLNFFYLKCRAFYTMLCEQIKKRYDFKNSVLSSLTIFSPKNAVSHTTRSKYPSLLPIMKVFQRFYEPDKRQLIDNEWRLLSNYVFQPEINLENDIDVFWDQLLKYRTEAGLLIFDNLAMFVLNILSLPHSNAGSERIFSKVNLIKTKVRNRLITKTINGTLLASEYVNKSSSENCLTFKPTKSMLTKMTKSMYSSLSSENSYDDDVFTIENADE